MSHNTLEVRVETCEMHYIDRSGVMAWLWVVGWDFTNNSFMVHWISTSLEPHSEPLSRTKCGGSTILFVLWNRNVYFLFNIHSASKMCLASGALTSTLQSGCWIGDDTTIWKVPGQPTWKILSCIPFKVHPTLISHFRKYIMPSPLCTSSLPRLPSYSLIIIMGGWYINPVYAVC